MAIRHVIVHESPDRTLVDRQTLAYVTQRSANTIRAVCEVVEHRDGKALYDLDAARERLLVTPTRGPQGVSLRP